MEGQRDVTTLVKRLELRVTILESMTAAEGRFRGKCPFRGNGRVYWTTRLPVPSSSLSLPAPRNGSVYSDYKAAGRFTRVSISVSACNACQHHDPVMLAS